MSNGDPTDTDERTVSVFVSGTDRSVTELADADRVVTTDATSAGGADAVVAVGDGALSALAAAGVSTPVVPIRETTDSPVEDISKALDRLSDEIDAVKRPVVGVETPDGSTESLRDVAFTAAEPGVISEFTVRSADETDGPAATDGGDRIARFRADGVVVATPAGSHGYAHAAGGPVVTAGSGVLAVVPVAPFATDPDHWVVPLSSLSVTVERNVDVAITVDGRPFGTLSPDATVRFVRAGTLRVVASALV